MPFRIILEKDFIGRNLELEALRNISLEVKEGISTSIFLSGQQGVGKTELMSQLFNLLFWEQDEVAPFIYNVNSAIVSARDFSTDYISRFIRQRIAFQKKDASLIHADGITLDKLMHFSEKSDAYWAVNSIKNFLNTLSDGNTTKILLAAICAPYHSYLSTGTPVAVIIDEFQKTKELYDLNPGNTTNLWMLFEEAVKSRRTPHIITGSQIELQEMFYQQTSLCKSMELFSLSGLDKNASLRLFNTLCESYNIIVDKDSLLPFVDLFRGNPLYIRNFIQAVRRKGEKLSLNDLWRIYFNEITGGQCYIYWLSLLRKYIPKLNQRKTSLALLHHLTNIRSESPRRDTPDTLSGLASMLSISMKDFEDMINVLQEAGIIEINFSKLKLTDDEVMIDFLKSLYCKEILEEPLSKLEKTFISEKVSIHKIKEFQSFEFTIPAVPKTELIAIKAFEQIAINQNISKEISGHLQMALIDLFTNIIGQEGSYNDNFLITFELHEDRVKIEIKTPYRELAFPTADTVSEEQLIRRYIDDIKFEKTKSGITITLLKNLKKDIPAEP